MKILDELPVATLVFLAGLVALVVAYVGDDIAFSELWEKLLFLGGGTAGIGYVRNQAGKGVRRNAG